jgi:hypothetical protein
VFKQNNRIAPARYNESKVGKRWLYLNNNKLMLIKDIQDVEVRKLALIRQQAYQGKSNIEQPLLTAFLFSSTPEGGSFWRKVKNKKK